MKIEKLIDFLICPDDGGELRIETETCIACIQCGRKFEVIEGVPVLFRESVQQGFTEKKWMIQNLPETLSKNDDYFENYYLPDVMKYLSRHVSKGKCFLEIGINAGFVAKAVAKKRMPTFGIDFSMDAVLYTKRLFKNEGLELGAVCGDITNMPFKDNVFNLIFGGGVIEHIDNSEDAVAEQRRCLVAGGITFQSVPAFSLSTMTYGQLWGGIPNFPLLKNIFKFIHMRLLGGGHMRFGFEKLFTLRQLNKIMNLNNLRVLESGVFKIYRPLMFINDPKIKEIANKLVT